ncbi:hypothetical protein [Rhodococcus sp. ACT016]|uniref:hypothetical protein n=1 Tax=Rhodococcus sp. ACT016 TaxID=3134808 RepID=UPI003D2E2C90
MQRGRSVGAVACLAAVVITGSACADSVSGAPQAQSGPASPSASSKSGVVPAALPTCEGIESTVTGVVSGFRLDPTPASPGAGNATMCFFVEKGKTGGHEFAVSIMPLDQNVDQLARTREYLTESKPGQVIDSPAATRLGGYISAPLGDGSLALAMPGAQVAVLTAGGFSLPREQVVDTLVAIGSGIAG